jgi:hypothetical protein
LSATKNLLFTEKEPVPAFELKIPDLDSANIFKFLPFDLLNFLNDAHEVPVTFWNIPVPVLAVR